MPDNGFILLNLSQEHRKCYATKEKTTTGEKVSSPISN
jgi:hypothetical protein